MFKFKNYFIFTLIALIIYPLGGSAKDLNTNQGQTVAGQTVQKSGAKNVKPTKPVLEITPQEMNIGLVAAGESVQRTVTLKNGGAAGAIHWYTEGPEGWKKTEQEKLSGTLESKQGSMQMEIRLVPKDTSGDDKQKNTMAYAELKLESGGAKLICTKKIHAGMYKEEIKINSASGQLTLLVNFIIAYTQKTPLVSLNSLRLDLGSIIPEKTISKKIILNNGGKEKLNWSVAVRKHGKEDIPDVFQQGRYISFLNEEIKESGTYSVTAHLKDAVEFAGKWSEKNGYPASAEGETLIKINFNGTGIKLYFLNYQKEGKLAISLDKQLIDDSDLLEDLEENEGEALIADALADGPHVLTIAGKDIRLIFEGMKILGGKTFFFPEGSIKILPNSGAITRQSNYLTVSVNPAQMLPGYYVDDILFHTNGSEATVEVFAEVLHENISKAVDIYRYYNGTDYLFTADPQAETKRLAQNNYLKEGIAFRLFKPETPGTTCFYRWYNPQTRSHFYHYDSTGGKKDLRGYLFEGSIGNIATSRLTNTRELYRWYNPKRGHYFYSTDNQGGKINKKLYRFDGIAGYVK